MTKINVTPSTPPEETGIDPIGDINACTGEDGKLHIRGWAFDKSDVNQTLLIHVYIGNEAHVIAANHSRPDVDDNYPGVGDNHGFDYYIQTNQVGLQWIQIWAINIGTGNNVQLWGNAVHIKPEGTDAISNGTYVISSSLDDNAVFDISEASMKDGGNLMICQYNGGDNQKFEVTYLGNNRYKMIAKHSGKSLDVQDAIHLVVLTCSMYAEWRNKSAMDASGRGRWILLYFQLYERIMYRSCRRKHCKQQ